MGADVFSFGARDSNLASLEEGEILAWIPKMLGHEMSALPFPDDDDPLPLARACELLFSNAITPSTLRAEARRGTLVLERIGRKDFVTPRAIREMRDKCRQDQKAPGSGSNPHDTRPKASSSSAPSCVSEMDQSSEARDALRAKLKRLRANSTTISPSDMPPLETATVTRLKLG